jgi:hypothetical protein
VVSSQGKCPVRPALHSFRLPDYVIPAVLPGKARQFQMISNRTRHQPHVGSLGSLQGGVPRRAATRQPGFMRAAISLACRRGGRHQYQTPWSSMRRPWPAQQKGGNSGSGQTYRHRNLPAMFHKCSLPRYTYRPQPRDSLRSSCLSGGQTSGGTIQTRKDERDYHAVNDLRRVRKAAGRSLQTS